MLQRLYEDLSVFFAYTLSLELEASERLRELAAAMALHHDPELTELFEELARNSEMHGAEVESLTEKLCVPSLRAWDCGRLISDSPRATDFAGMHYSMSAKDALETALEVEYKAARFYRDIANNTEDPEIKNFATQFAAEKKKHVIKLKQKMKDLASRTIKPQKFTKDPANSGS